ncbi:MAG: hypothetical protein QM784_00340 [Polyangiaceae bacterium]
MTAPGPLTERTSGVAALQRVVDVALIVGGIYVAAWLYRQPFSTPYTMTAAIAASAFLLFAEFNGLYRTESTVRFSTEIFGFVVTWGGVFCGLLGLAFATKTSAFFSRAIILGWAVGVPVTACVLRVGLRALLRHLRRRGVNTQAVAIAGCTPVAVRLLECFRDDPTLGFVVSGVYDDRSAPRRCAEVETLAPVIGALSDVVEAARNRKIDVVYVTLPMRAEARTIELIRRLADTTATVYFVRISSCSTYCMRAGVRSVMSPCSAFSIRRFRGPAAG